MSDLLNQASLVMVPSGYKEDTVYSVVPSDGSGDLTFTRASNGTRVNSAGLVEVCPWNLFQQSENFPNAIWTKSTLTFNSTVTAPNGTSTAQNYSTAGAYSYVLQTITVSSGEYYTVSCYLKYTSGVGSISIGYTDAPSNNFIRVDANLINGTIGSVSYGGNGANGTATITSVGDGWYRVTVSGTLTIGNAGLIVSNLALGATTFSIWGAQLNIGSTAKPYFPTTDRLNVPRLTYQNGGGGCPSLLLEPQRTNLALYSQQLDDASWLKINTSATANTTTAPDGTLTADTILANGVSALHVAQTNNISFTTSTNYSFSIFAKKGTNNFIQLIASNSIGGMFANFDLDSGVVGTLGTTTGTTPTSSITNCGNGWYRCVMNFTANATTGQVASIAIVTSASAARAESNTLATSVFLYGAQLEAGAYPTTYISTTSATATRVADSFSRNNIYTNGLITASGGTWFVELRNNISYTRDTFTVGLFISDTNDITNNNINIRCGGTSRLAINKVISGVSTFLYQTSTTTVKLAIKWNGTTMDIFENGVKVISATSFTPTNMQFLGCSSTQVPVFIQAMALYPTALSDSDCQTITAL